MDEYAPDRDAFSRAARYWAGLPAAVRAALVFALPFMVVDFFNYYTAGTALVISTPILAIMYAACGGLAAKFRAAKRSSTSDLLLVGLGSGLALWLVSTLVNTLISLIIGAASLGATLLLGIPYLCLCAPVQLAGGGLMGTLGGWIYSLLGKGTGSESGTGDFYG